MIKITRLGCDYLGMPEYGLINMLIKVAVAGPFEKGLDYIYPFDHPAILYTRVIVPLARREVIGIIIDVDITTTHSPQKLKKVIKNIDHQALLSATTIAFLQWMQAYYHACYYQILKLLVPKLLLQRENAGIQKAICYRLKSKKDAMNQVAKNAKQQIKIIVLLQQQDVLAHADLSKYNIKLEAIKALINKGIIKEFTQLPSYQNNAYNPDRAPKILNTEQKKAVASIQQHFEHFRTILLYGVTGSGKTEVYLQAISPLIRAKKQVLIMVPEINLTPQTVKRFAEHFNVAVIAVHSNITDQMRLEYWLAVKANKIQIVIATRAGLFFEFADLAMVIVDEEHDASFKQQNGVHYHGRNLAIVKAKMLNIPIVLGSGTPSIESYYHAKQGKYALITLNSKACNAEKNDVYIINLQHQKTEAGLTNRLMAKVEQCLDKGGQALLFVARRGFAHSLICKDCGWCADCESCEKPYTLHLHPQHLACHFCGKSRGIYQRCPKCHSDNLMDFGSGTEKIEEYLAMQFPKARITRLDRTVTRKKGALEQQLQHITTGNSDIIIGTQMITKGHDFQKVALVGIINVDAGFYSPDFHAVERTAQLITQVAGRTGRGDKKGAIYIQTYQPDNPTLNLILQGNYTLFLSRLLETRQLLDYPPYRYQTYIYSQAVKAKTCIDALESIKIIIEKAINVEHADTVIGPVPGIHLKQANKFRFTLMITTTTRTAMQQILKAVYPGVTHDRRAKITMDIDPIEIK